MNVEIVSEFDIWLKAIQLLGFKIQDYILSVTSFLLFIDMNTLQ